MLKYVPLALLCFTRKPSVTSSLSLTLIVLRLARVIASISAIVNRPCSLMMESICSESSGRLTIIFSRSIFFANLEWQQSAFG